MQITLFFDVHLLLALFWVRNSSSFANHLAVKKTVSGLITFKGIWVGCFSNYLMVIWDQCYFWVSLIDGFIDAFTDIDECADPEVKADPFIQIKSNA